MHDSAALVAAMQQPDFYPHAADAVEMLQTHASWVFLAGDYAYKLKKPVNFGFLDFSSKEKRGRLCAEELRLNRRLAPEIYLEVLPVSRRADGGFALDDKRDICDWCLKMRRFAQSDLLSRRLEEGRFDGQWMDMLAADIARFHAACESSPNAEKYGSRDMLAAHMTASLDVADAHADIIGKAMLDALREQMIRQLDKRAACFAQRIADDRIRDGHGDLHLGNIALLSNHPTAFDCIEFNEEYRMIDVLNDAAFLVMDCMARSRADLGLRFLSRYLEFSGDYAGMPLTRLFLSYRAGVRGKVACLLAGDAALAASESQRKFAEAARYFSLAARVLREPRKPTLFIIGGLSGSGKSRLALRGCGEEEAIVIRSDATRKRLASARPDLPLYGEAMNEMTYNAMLTAAKTLLGCGWPVILDATFLNPGHRDACRRLAAECGAGFSALWLDVEEENLRANIRRRMAQGRDISDADLDVLESQLKRYRKPQEPGIRFLTDANTWPGREKSG